VKVAISMGQSFRDLTVWQRAIDLTVCIYELTAEFPNAEIYGLSSQMRRAAVSVSSNIAEGAGRGGKKEFRQFLSMARGSNCELQTQLLISSRLKIASQEQLLKANGLSQEVGRMLNGLSRSLAERLKADN
jgi:four helix bundle protein